MARSKSIREDVQFYIDILFDLYDQTDPDLGEESAYNKTEVANYAIEVWWRLHGKLMAWTQNHTVGHAIMTENPEFSNWFQKTLGRDVDEDGHERGHLAPLGNHIVFIPGLEAPSISDFGLSPT